MSLSGTVDLFPIKPLAGNDVNYTANQGGEKCWKCSVVDRKVGCRVGDAS